MNRPPVTVPVGLGGKTNPYVPDPAPTLVIEFPSVETDRELARIAALETAARDEAAQIIEEARAEARRLQTESAAEAETLRSTAEAERREAQEQIARDRQSLEDTQSQVAARSDELDSQERELESRRSALEERLARADDDIAEAARILAQARTDAESILEEAQTTADAMLQETVSHAEAAAAELINEARTSVDTDELVAQRVAELESMHRVEVQVLTERESELLDRIARLESAISEAKTAEPTKEAPSDDEPVAIALEREGVAVSVPESRTHSGRHSSDPADTANRAIASHAPLTEQLSTSVFRTAAERDRKGKRRR